jgi:hypothetical protein
LLSFGAETPSHDDARRFITEELLQRRLFFHDPVVPLEALTAINSALMRALELTQRGALTAHARDFHFFDLIAMVGTLAERRMNELEGDHPLRTEIIRFFALSLLFVPDGVFALAATISECGLTETSRDVGKLVAEYANRTCLQLEKELGCNNLEPQRAQLARYAEYLKWRERSEAPSGPARPAANTNDLSDARVMEEAWKMTRAAAALRELFEPAGDAELDRWLDEDVPERDCLAHSRGCLRQLRHYRRELRSQLEKRPDAFDGESNRPRYPAARATCKEAEAFLKKPGRIFEPQRSKYLEIVERWQDYIQRQQEHPLPMLELVDSFNRHVYQATADDLAASLQELALRTVPLSFADLRESDRASSLRWLIRRGLHAHPLLLDVYERGIRLVEDAHLSGTLLAVAKSIASGIPIAKGAGRGSVGLEEIENRLRQLSNSNQLDFLPHFSGGYDSPVTGSLDVWDAILQEWTRNVRKYGATPQRRFFASWSRTDTSNTLSMQGDRAFSESLVEPYRSMELHRVVDRIGKDTGKPFGSSDERSNGFGLFLVFSLCRLVGLKARLELAQGFALPEEAPLVLRIEWTHRK